MLLLLLLLFFVNAILICYRRSLLYKPSQNKRIYIYIYIYNFFLSYDWTHIYDICYSVLIRKLRSQTSSGLFSHTPVACVTSPQSHFTHVSSVSLLGSLQFCGRRFWRYSHYSMNRLAQSFQLLVWVGQPGFEIRQGQDFLSSPPRPVRLRDLLTLNTEYRRPFIGREQTGQSAKLTTHLQLVPRLGKFTAVSIPPYALMECYLDTRTNYSFVFT
jgi:hypothetical protein